MNRFTTLFTWLGRSIGLGPSSQRFWAAWAGSETWAGETVTPERVMTISAMWRAIRLIAETVATLPIDVYRVGADGTAKLVTDPANNYRQVLKISPNQDQTPVEFWEGLVGCMLLCGDGFARKIKVGKRLVAMTLMDPTKTNVLREAAGVLKFRYTDYGGNTIVLDSDDVFHLKGFGFGGDRGMSLVQYGAQSLSSTIAADKVAGKMFRSGLSSSGFLETGQVLNEPDRARLTQIMADYQGSDKAGKIMILEGGMKYNPVSMSAADAQLLEARGYNIEEVARWAGIPPVLLGHNAAGQTMWGSGLEQIIQAWYTLGLRALLHRIETAISKRCITAEDAGRYFARFNVEGLLRGDTAARAAFYSTLVQNGIMTRNEVRELEDLERDTSPGADKLTAQTNLTTLDKIGEAPAAAPGGGGDPAQAFRENVKNFLGLQDAPSQQDLAEIRLTLASLRRRDEILATMIDQPEPRRLPAPPAARDAPPAPAAAP